MLEAFPSDVNYTTADRALFTKWPAQEPVALSSAPKALPGDIGVERTNVNSTFLLQIREREKQLRLIPCRITLVAEADHLPAQVRLSKVIAAFFRPRGLREEQSQEQSLCHSRNDSALSNSSWPHRLQVAIIALLWRSALRLLMDKECQLCFSPSF